MKALLHQMQKHMQYEGAIEKVVWQTVRKQFYESIRSNYIHKSDKQRYNNVSLIERAIFNRHHRFPGFV